ncbi:30S ribosomal protein S6 [Tuwongella immobilis]|uniref:Small ribosomal subunit protein bS6 n=1 Tax=Tuwongella immobilis TaxID=692036 RepID=A0A6C2YV96_9BACT|nr:30S ribosomal protein S6 [Tuwongella immobilis]VIP04909.1 30s ribosomal protein s6 : 30S ribosomal protein S6 OS=Pirellula staleyi (strain ATCC 27377 / DSM 6068 / ICPB 4128) GN=rpsF PE=3 SV=1: Ribosomal_S6 [Tuwongella immobilis]VTS07177.1 30s ribosomal protein s6 : 30S ribosomal protein S6 OS=Pirellula staleyi (strain ATCC 27377 / DSM 6068 / ICPB 4128) GN=rpsF PE=3 SV=1: Ribosomal_S6 [Tuwongella immobilis]
MPVNLYECLILLDSNKTAGSEQLEAAKTFLHSSLEKQQAEVMASRVWDDRRLAYPIDGQKKALYYLLDFRMDSLKVKEFERDLKLNAELVIRFMTVKIDPKHEEAMLAVARNEREFALRTMTDESIDGEDEMRMDSPPRRSRRPVGDAEGK